MWDSFLVLLAFILNHNMCLPLYELSEIYLKEIRTKLGPALLCSVTAEEGRFPNWDTFILRKGLILRSLLLDWIELKLNFVLINYRLGRNILSDNGLDNNRFDD